MFLNLWRIEQFYNETWINLYRLSSSVVTLKYKISKSIKSYLRLILKQLYDKKWNINDFKDC